MVHRSQENIQNPLFFIIFSFVSMFFFCSFRRSLTHSLAPICFASFLVLFGYSSFTLPYPSLAWPCLSLVSWPCNPLFFWPCNPLFSSLGGFFPGLEFPPFFFSFFCPLFFSPSFFALPLLVFVSLPPSLNFFSFIR